MNRFKITTLMLLLSSLVSRADSVVVPNNPPIDSGGGWIVQNPGLDVRYQEVFPASQFGTDSGALLITQFAWRQGTSGGSLDAIVPSLEIRMSTTFATPTTLSSTLDANVGLDQTIVLPQSSYHLLASQNPSGTGPFDLRFSLAHPFTYNPAQGNLLIELSISSPASGQRIDFGNLNDANGVGFAVSGASFVFNAGPVTEFTFSQIPEPKTFFLVVTGLIALVKRGQS